MIKPVQRVPTVGERRTTVPNAQEPMPGNGYEALPEAIKAGLSPKDYEWMDDESRRNIIKDMTSPEVAED